MGNWLVYDTENNIIKIDNRQMINKEYYIYVYNITRSKESAVCPYVRDDKHNLSIPNVIEKIESGLNKIVITPKGNGFDKSILASDQYTQVFYYYKSRDALFKVHIIKKEYCDRLLISVKSDEVPIPKGRIYYKIGNYPFRFDFDLLEAGEEKYYAIKKPEEGIHFYVDDFQVPQGAVCYPNEKLEYGIDLDVKLFSK